MYMWPETLWVWVQAKAVCELEAGNAAKHHARQPRNSAVLERRPPSPIINVVYQKTLLQITEVSNLF